MNLLLRILSSIAAGLFTYLFMLCEPKGGDRHFMDLFTNPDKFFNTFDPAMFTLDVQMPALFGIIIGLCVFIFWQEGSLKP